MHPQNIFETLDRLILIKEEYYEVLESRIFLKEKSDITAKFMIEDGGNKQHITVDNEDAASPTAALESVLLTLTIDTK